MSPCAARWRSSAGARMPACTVTVARLAVELEHRAPCGACRAPPRRRARRAAAPRRRRRSCRRRTARPRARLARTARARRAAARGAREDDRVGRPVGRPGAQAHEVRIALAGGVQRPARRDRRGRPRRRRSRAAALERCSAQAATGAAHALRARPAGADARASPTRLAQEAQRVRGQRRRVAPDRPSPTSASRGRRARARQPLIRSRPSSASSIVAAAARRTMQPPKRARRSRSASGAARSSPPSRPPHRAVEAHLGLGRVQHARERRALDAAAPSQRRARARRRARA